MPNHVTCELTAPKQVLDALVNGDRLVDFNTLVPMPQFMLECEPRSGIVEWAKIAMGVVTVSTIEETVTRLGSLDPKAAFEAQDFGSLADRLSAGGAMQALRQGPYPKDYSPKDFADLLTCMRCIKETGHAYWLDWAYANWGTKWNAYGAQRVSDTVVKFQTAWSMPKGIFNALAKKWPNKTLKIRWADEDFGNSVGTVTYKDQAFGLNELVDGSHEAKELALELIFDGKVPEHMKRDEKGELAYVND